MSNNSIIYTAMKDFFSKNKRAVFLIAAVVVFVFIFTTAAVTQPDKNREEIIDNISTCSIPEGKIIAKGIDVSFYQGDIDFNAVKDSGVGFVILKAGSTGFGADSKFERYYSDARAAGLDIGCYYYTYSTTAEGVKADADELLGIIDGKTFSYPVFLDFEEEAVQTADMIDTNTSMINTFCNIIKQSGYYPGVYTSSSVYNNYIESISLGSAWDFWIASYDDHTCESDEYHSDFSMWQYSNAGQIKGIDSDVDLDVAYVDYPKLIREFKDKILKYTS